MSPRCQSSCCVFEWESEMSSTVVSAVVQSEKAEGYDRLEELVRTRVGSISGPVFTTSAKDLFETYLDNLPPGRRQHYNCNCCRRFIDRFGGLVTVNADGKTRSAMWHDYVDAPEVFRQFVFAVDADVRRAKVTGVFLSSEATWGTPENVPGPGSKYVGQRWTHLSGTNPWVWNGKSQTADQAMAEKKEDFNVLVRALVEYTPDVIREAIRALDAGVLSRSEKAYQIGQWFLAVRVAWDSLRGSAKTNKVWLAAATAPPGWCHVKNTVIATLLDDIKAGMPFEAVSRRWKEKMHPLQYQRPTALKAGNIEGAEKLIAKLGAGRSLERRFAKLEEVTAVWNPSAVRAEPEPAAGVFGYLKSRAKDAVRPVTPLVLPAKKVSWLKFESDVLPSARTIEVLVPTGRASFFGMVTAAHADALPVLQWDGLDGQPRNPVSWYFYHSGSFAAVWGLQSGTYAKVAAVCHTPPHWQRPEQFAHQVRGAMFVLEGCRDVNHTAGGGLFPECLRAEFREVRASIAAHSNAAEIAGKDEGTANGLYVQQGSAFPKYRLRVTSGGAPQEYIVDRWE